MDFRIDVGFIEHPKTLRLLRRLGDKGLTALLTLWTWCTKYYPDGNLPDLNGDDINAGARWNGEADFAEVLVEIGFIDKDENGGYHLHDWKTHNPYAAEGGERAEKARFSKLAQVVPSAYRELSAAGIDRITQDEYQRIVSETKNKQQRSVSETQSERRASAEPNASETLAPSPDPSPTPKPRRFSEEGEISDPKEDPPPNPPPVTGGGGERDGFPLPTQSKRKQPKPEPPEFADFYAAYPRKVARSTALKAWLRIRPDPADVMEGLSRWIRVWDSRGEEGRRFIPYPATFLNQERWKECEESDGRSGRSITEHWDSKTGGGWKPSNHWGENVPTDEELDNILEQTFGDMRNAPIQPGAGHI